MDILISLKNFLFYMKITNLGIMCIYECLSVSLTYFSSNQPGGFQISDEDRLLSFIGSYSIGTRIIRGANLSICLMYAIYFLCLSFTHHFGFSGLKGSFLSNLDARLAPEHMLRLCLEHEQKFVPSHKSACRYNFYKV